MPSLVKNPKVKEMLKTASSFVMVQAFFLMLMVSFGVLGQKVFYVIIVGPTILSWFYATKNGYFSLLCYICITIAMGQRTMYIGKYCRIVPAEILYYFLAFSCFLFSRQHFRFSPKLPGMALFLLLTAAGWGVVLVNIDLPWEYLRLNKNVNLAFSYAKGFWLILPILYCMKRVIRTTSQIHDITFILSAEAFFLSFLSFIEFYDIPIIGAFSGFLQAKMTSTQSGFHRASCSFWGNPMMGAVLCAFFPLCLAEWAKAKTGLKKVILAASITLSLWCIYSVGSRGAWVSFFVAMSIFFTLKGVKGIATLFILCAIGLAIIPKELYLRMGETFGPNMEGGTVDRIRRFEHTMLLIRTSPLMGSGWGAAGLAHTDWLQIWADTGILGFIGFFLLFLAYFMRLIKFLSRKNVPFVHKEYARAFFASIVFYGLLLLNAPMLNNPEQYPPFWTIYALGFIYPSVWQRDNALVLEEIRQAPKMDSPDLKP